MAPLPTVHILQEKYELEFCPPLDTVLVAALVADLYMETPTQHQIDELHDTLSLLAAQADQQAEHDERALMDDSADVNADDNSSSAPGDSSLGSEAVSTSYATTVNGSPQSQTSSVESFSSPLGFLQTAFPNVPSDVLRRALEECGDSFDDPENVNILPVIEDLLSQEAIKEYEEREEAEEYAPSPTQRWFVVQPKKKKAKGKTIALNDVRQQHHVRPVSSAPPVDTWTAVSSLSSRLATLLPSYPESYFASFFHSPSNRTPASAVRAALSALTSPNTIDSDLLATIREILCSAPEYDDLDAEERDTLLSDAALCLRASDAQADAALDLVWLLRNLDEDEAGEWAMGPYHRPAPAPPPPSVAQRKLPDGAPEPILPRTAQTRKTPTAPAPPPNAWKVIPQKKLGNGANPHAAFIPAYNPFNGARQGAGSPATATHNGSVKTTSPPHKEAQKQSRRMRDLQARRAEAIMAAGRAWQKGSAKNHGGEVALYYAEQAKELQEEARRAALDDARSRVEAGRTTSASGTTIDLHWTTVGEAVALAKEALEDYGSSHAKPLKVITGRGKHSHQGKGVLLPAVKSALLEDGWNVSTFDAGIVVRGRLIGGR